VAREGEEEVLHILLLLPEGLRLGGEELLLFLFPRLFIKNDLKKRDLRGRKESANVGRGGKRRRREEGGGERRGRKRRRRRRRGTTQERQRREEVGEKEGEEEEGGGKKERRRWREEGEGGGKKERRWRWRSRRGAEVPHYIAEYHCPSERKKEEVVERRGCAEEGEE